VRNSLLPSNAKKKDHHHTKVTKKQDKKGHQKNTHIMAKASPEDLKALFDTQQGYVFQW
jgi:hypothetical protein